MASASEASGETRLLLEHPELWRGALVIGAPMSEVPLLEPCRHFSFFDGAAEGVECGERPSRGDETTVVVYLPKGGKRRDLLFAMAAELGMQIAVVGQKKAGIKGARSALRRYYENVQVRSYGHHAQLLWGQQARSGAPKAPGVTWWDTGLGFEAASYPGTFSAGRLDEGTRRFLEALDAEDAWPAGGRALDLACGSGVIGVCGARRGPECEWTLADVDHLAVAAARLTAQRAGVDVDIIASDVYSKVEGMFDRILTNPPFHQGQNTDQSVPHRMIAEAPSRLNAGGELWLVANHFLPYERWMNESFDVVHNRFEDSKFKVLMGTKK